MTKIILKKSPVTGKVPVAGDLDYGELALNYADGALYYKDSSNTIQSISTGSTTTVSSSPPANPGVGDIWVDSDTGIKYTYIDDGNSQQWVELEADLVLSSGGGTAAATSSVYSAEYSLQNTTTDATQTELFVDGVLNQRISVPLNKSLSYTVEITCRRTDVSGDYAAWFIKGVVANSAGTTTDIGSLYEVILVRTDSNMVVDVLADNTTDTLNLYVTGASGKAISWKAVVTTIEV